MTNAKHTPGPWRVDPDHSGDIQTIDGLIEIGAAFGASSKEVPWTVRGIVPSDKDGMANAHLIAAAPDLLEALKAADYYINRLEAVQRRRVVRDMTEAMEGYYRTRIAIAKAEGRS